MSLKKQIIEYLITTYNPEAIITYGSYADGTANANSDFDALIVANSSKIHDESVVSGITLDVFIYPTEIDIENIDADNFIQIHDGKIELDKNGIASRLKEKVLNYIENIPFKSETEIHQEIEWCKKMALRTKRDDVEGYFRWHWLLMDSLEIYFDIIQERYWGPKKSLLKLRERDSEAYKIYGAALRNFNQETLSDWIDYIEKSFSVNEQ